MKKIIQLSEICLSLEESKELNNKYPSAIAWVFNPYKNLVEFELVPVSKLDVSDNEGVIGFKVKEGKWEMWQSEVFVSMEQINALIEKGHFYYAPIQKNLI